MLFNKDATALTTKSVSGFQKLLQEAVDKMDHLTSIFFDLHSVHVDDMERYLPAVTFLWSLLLGRVNSLSVRIREKHAHLLYSTFSNLLGVKHLSITFQGISDNGAHGLADLINTASQSLESLRFEIFFISSPFHAVFTGLHICPRLKRVELSLYNAIGPEMATFLNLHGESIEELELSFGRPIYGPPFAVAPLQLPSLRRLSVAWNLFSWGDENPFQQLWTDAYFPALDSLKIISPFMDVDHIAIFCDMFKRSGGAGVRRLELPCRTMNADIFDHLSEGFPNLHTLILPTIFLSNFRYSCPNWNIDSFANELGCRDYPNWTLYDLEITPPGSQSFGPVDYVSPISYVAMRIAASHIPSVRSFCGSGHMDVPKGAKYSIRTPQHYVRPRLVPRE
ncbi:hypothetical protein EYR40_009439 [Pleurotus pulmonarius]|nr:hypothetical protein EYR40_009439 [Pleurotus pulmonarius]